MNILKSTLVASSIAMAAVLSVPAAAQVQGKIATVNMPAVVIGTNAFGTAYQQIGTTYKLQIDTLQQRNQERQTLLKQLDKNNDGQLDEAEQTAAQNSTQAQRIAQIEQEMGQLTNQIDGARVYAVEQILAQYGASIEQVVQQLQIQLVLTPDVVVYAPPAANITKQVTAALNAKVAAVNIVPPQGWQPNRNSVAVYQEINQLLQIVAAQQAQQQGAQQPQQTPPAPSGR